MSDQNRRVVETHWRGVEMPAVLETHCTSCGWCVEVCPTRCLAMGVHLPNLPRPLDCVSCTLCALICPADAIEMRGV